MPIHQKQPHILSDLSFELLVYRLLLLSPFEVLRNQQIVSTWRVKLYMFTFFLVYALLRVYLCIILVSNDKIFQTVFSYDGQIWKVVQILIFGLVALLFVGIVMNAVLMNKHQIKFYADLHDFDFKLSADFGVSIGRSRMRAINRWSLIVNLCYNFFDSIYYWNTHVPPILTFSQRFAYFVIYYFSNIIGFVSVLQFVNCTQLCRERMEIIKKLLRNKSHTVRIGIVLHLYARIRGQIVLINKFMGFVVLIKLIHDFTVGTSILYMMFVSSYDDGITEFCEMLWWFSHNIIGAALMTFLSEMLTSDVSINDDSDIHLLQKSYYFA